MDFFLGMFAGILLTSVVFKIVTWLTWREMRRRGIERILADLEHGASFENQPLSLRIESYQDEFLFFDAHTKKFITQGRTYQEVSDSLQRMFQNHPAATITITEGNAEDIDRFRATQVS